jgi:hypothetical protein
VAGMAAGVETAKARGAAMRAKPVGWAVSGPRERREIADMLAMVARRRGETSAAVCQSRRADDRLSFAVAMLERIGRQLRPVWYCRGHGAKATFRSRSIVPDAVPGGHRGSDGQARPALLHTFLPAVPVFSLMPAPLPRRVRMLWALS